MPAVEESIIIEIPPETVFRFTTDPRNVPRYSSNIIEYEKVDESPVEVGAPVRDCAKVAGRRIDFVYEVIEFDPPTRYASTTFESPIPFRVTQQYEETAAGTRLDQLPEFDGFGGFFGKLTESVVVSLYAGDLQSSLARLKRLIESGTA